MIIYLAILVLAVISVASLFGSLLKMKFWDSIMLSILTHSALIYFVVVIYAVIKSA